MIESKEKDETHLVDRRFGESLRLGMNGKQQIPINFTRYFCVKSWSRNVRIFEWPYYLFIIALGNKLFFCDWKEITCFVKFCSAFKYVTT